MSANVSLCCRCVDILLNDKGYLETLARRYFLWIFRYAETTVVLLVVGLRNAQALASSVHVPSWNEVQAFGEEGIKSTEAALVDFARALNAIVDFKSTVQIISSTAEVLRADVEALTRERGLLMKDVSNELEKIFLGIVEELKHAFPPPAEAPTHEEREKVVAAFLDKAEGGFVALVERHGMPEDALAAFDGTVHHFRLLVEGLVVTTGVCTAQL